MRRVVKKEDGKSEQEILDLRLGMFEEDVDGFNTSDDEEEQLTDGEDLPKEEPAYFHRHARYTISQVDHTYQESIVRADPEDVVEDFSEADASTVGGDDVLEIISEVLNEGFEAENYDSQSPESSPTTSPRSHRSISRSGSGRGGTY